jgi:hypothetical protein
VSFLRDIGVPPWLAKSELSGNLAAVVLALLVLVVVPALASRRDAKISSDMIRAEFFSAVEKSAVWQSSTNVVRENRADDLFARFRVQLRATILRRTRWFRRTSKGVAQILAQICRSQA